MEDGGFMIMLIGSTTVVKRTFFHKQNIIIDNRLILGMKVLEMTVPIAKNIKNKSKERIKRKVLEALSKHRVNTVCLKNDFPYPEWFSDYRMPKGNDVIKRLLGKIAVMASGKHELVYADLYRADRDSLKALSDMCEGFRFVCVSVRNGEASEISKSMIKSCGASIIAEPTAERIKSADAAVFFEQPMVFPEINKACVIIDVDNTKIDFCLSDGTELNIPDGYSQKALISEAIIRGYIRFEDIHIRELK